MARVTDLYRYIFPSEDGSDDDPKPVATHGMGRVYKAFDLLTNEVVALKVVRDDLLTQQPEKAKRGFLAEAIAGARLGRECIHIVRVYDIGQFEDILYMAQEWVPGGNILSQCGKVTCAKARTIMFQVTAGVQVAHRHGIVHSDIAPANILHDSRRDVYKLSDFGLLKLMNETSVSITGSSTLMAGGRRDFMPTAHYLDPSQINGSTDVYALAVTFYVLLTGELPPREDGEYAIPGAIPIAGERNRQAPFSVNTLLDKFVKRRRDAHTIEQFAEDLSRVTA